MDRTWRTTALACAAAAIALLGAACSGGGGSKSTATPAGTETPQGEPTPFATPVVSGNQLTSVKGYAVTFPQGWKVRANLINTADATVDAFFEPAAAQPAPGQVQANISVNCQVVRVTGPAEFLSDSATRTAKLPQNKNISVSETSVNGVKATALRYRFESAQDAAAPKLEKLDVIFSNSKCDWTITLATPADQLDKYKPIFDAFLSSFRLT
jgi:hypothetical protein